MLNIRNIDVKHKKYIDVKHKKIQMLNIDVKHKKYRC